MALIQFPDNFTWGAASSSYQIEGAWNEEGKGENIWDHYTHRPYQIRNGDTGDIACDSYHRMEEDVALMQGLGLQAYRFSISWARVLAEGVGRPNQKGLDYYDRLVDQMCAANVRPVAALNHWDFPQALQDEGGWQNRDSADWFCEYASLMFSRLNDRVKMWVTHNEPRVIAFLGYGAAIMAPGIADTSAAYQVVHHLLLAHGKAVQAYRQSGANGKIGIVIDSENSIPASGSESDQDAWQRYYEQDTGIFGDALFKGEYPKMLMDWIGPMAPRILPGDMDLIRNSLDFMGINYYRGSEICFNEMGGYLKCSANPRKTPMAGFTEVGWGVYPAGLKAVLVNIKECYGNPEVFMTENGCATRDIHNPEGYVDDLERIEFLRGHLLAAHEAIKAGCNLKGYFTWSMLDNFEWSHGFEPRFGLVRVDYESQKRIPKRSYNWYRQVIEQNGVME